MNLVNNNAGTGGKVEQCPDCEFPKTIHVIDKCATDSEDQGHEHVACVWSGVVKFDICRNRAGDLGLHEGILEGRGPCPHADGEEQGTRMNLSSQVAKDVRCGGSIWAIVGDCPGDDNEEVEEGSEGGDAKHNARDGDIDLPKVTRESAAEKQE